MRAQPTMAHRQLRPQWCSGFGGVAIFMLLAVWCGGVDAFECSSRRTSSVRPHHTLSASTSRYSQSHVLEMAKEDRSIEERRQEIGTKTLEAIAQNLVNNGEAETIKEAIDLHMSRMREAKFSKYTEEEIRDIGRKAVAAAAQKLVDDGEAETIKDAIDLRMSRIREAVAQKIVDNGEAETIKEAIGLHMSRIREAGAQKLVDSGEAETIKEAIDLQMSRMREAKFSKYTEEEIRDMGRKASAAAAQKLVDNGEAETIKEAIDLHMSRMREAFEAKYTEEEIRDIGRKAMSRAREALEAKYNEKELVELCVKRGVASVIKRGHRTKYPGVNFHKVSNKWRVHFRHKGKGIYVGLYATEWEGVIAHDEYVRAHGLERRLHVPEAGEASSQSPTMQPKPSRSEDD